MSHLSQKLIAFFLVILTKHVKYIIKIFLKTTIALIIETKIDFYFFIQIFNEKYIFYCVISQHGQRTFYNQLYLSFNTNAVFFYFMRMLQCRVNRVKSRSCVKNGQNVFLRNVLGQGDITLKKTTFPFHPSLFHQHVKRYRIIDTKATG